MEFEVLKIHILRPTLSADMVQWVLQWESQKRRSRRKRQGPMADNNNNNNNILFKFILGKRR